MTTQIATTWAIKGDALGACSCDWGCPCSFDAKPTYGSCEGSYAFHITEGRFNNVKLDGLSFGLAVHSPAALHLGNVTAYVWMDEKATPTQREALGTLASGAAGGVFAIFAGLITKLIGPEFLPVECVIDGPKSHVKVGDRLEIALALITSPVTGEESGFKLQMTKGLLTDESHPMTNRIFRLSHPELSYDHSGQYGETFKFNYRSEQ